jgi:acetyltransferase-like isoleucine patch superfamily enzyme
MSVKECYKTERRTVRFRYWVIKRPWLWPYAVLYYFTRPIPPGLFFINFIFQRIFRINGEIPWMVNFTSRVSGNIKIGKNVWISFAVSGGCYVQGINGIEIGDNTIFAPGVKIISANHDPNDYNKWIKCSPIKIGKNCWIGANAVILPGVQLGDNVIVGAGSVVTKSFPNNCTIAGVPAKIIKLKQ